MLDDLDTEILALASGPEKDLIDFGDEDVSEKKSEFISFIKSSPSDSDIRDLQSQPDLWIHILFILQAYVLWTVAAKSDI